VDDATPRKRRTRKKMVRRLIWASVILATVIVVLVVGVVIDAAVLNGKIVRVDVKHLAKAPTKGRLLGTENILLVGSTSRCALKTQNPAYGLCDAGITGVNSDVVMILHLNPNVPSASILSLPRDLFVPNARTDGANRINAALADGPSQLVAAIEEDFGIPIEHYVELNFDSFAGVVNALGGVKMYFPMPLYDKFSGLNQTVPGCRPLNGIEALQVVRARHLQYDPPGLPETTPQSEWPQDPESDLSRITRDHEFLRVLATAVAKRGLGNPFTDQSLVSSVVSDLQADTGFSLSDMVHLVLTFHSVNINKAPQLTLPVMVVDTVSYQYQGYNYGNIEFPNEQLDLAAIDQALGITKNTYPMTGGQLPQPTAVTVSVENGTDVANQATTTSTALSALGFHMVGVGDTTPVGPVAETVVNYSKAAYEPEAEKVAQSMSGAVVVGMGPTTDGAEVTVVTGTDFSVNAPGSTTTTAGSSTSSTSAVPTTTPTTSPATSSGESIDPPSSSDQPLSAFDPRSCTATGGEGS
jgi:LCP family protein required for cell wall assembly